MPTATPTPIGIAALELPSCCGGLKGAVMGGLATASGNVSEGVARGPGVVPVSSGILSGGAELCVVVGSVAVSMGGVSDEARLESVTVVSVGCPNDGSTSPDAFVVLGMSLPSVVVSSAVVLSSAEVDGFGFTPAVAYTSMSPGPKVSNFNQDGRGEIWRIPWMSKEPPSKKQGPSCKVACSSQDQCVPSLSVHE